MHFSTINFSKFTSCSIATSIVNTKTISLMFMISFTIQHWFFCLEASVVDGAHFLSSFGGVVLVHDVHTLNQKCPCIWKWGAKSRNMRNEDWVMKNMKKRTQRETRKMINTREMRKPIIDTREMKKTMIDTKWESLRHPLWPFEGR